MFKHTCYRFTRYTDHGLCIGPMWEAVVEYYLIHKTHVVEEKHACCTGGHFDPITMSIYTLANTRRGTGWGTGDRVEIMSEWYEY